MVHPCKLLCVIFPCRVLHPSVLWAQRADTVLLTIELNDIQNEKYTLNEKSLKFSGQGGTHGDSYELELDFYGEVNPEVM